MAPPASAVRTHRLEAQGYRIIRFSNEQVIRELDPVVEAISAVIGEVEAASPCDDRFSGALPCVDPAP